MCVVIHRITGDILNGCLTRKITGVAFPTPTIAFMPDPEAAAALMKAMNDVYNLGLDTKELLKRARKIEQKLKEVAKNYQRMKQTESRKGAPEGLYA